MLDDVVVSPCTARPTKMRGPMTDTYVDRDVNFSWNANRASAGFAYPFAARDSYAPLGLPRRVSWRRWCSKCRLG